MKSKSIGQRAFLQVSVLGGGGILICVHLRSSAVEGFFDLHFAEPSHRIGTMQHQLWRCAQIRFPPGLMLWRDSECLSSRPFRRRD